MIEMVADAPADLWIDDREFSLREFGRMLTTFAGWGCGSFVAKNGWKTPRVEVREPLVVRTHGLTTQGGGRRNREKSLGAEVFPPLGSKAQIADSLHQARIPGAIGARDCVAVIKGILALTCPARTPESPTRRRAPLLQEYCHDQKTLLRGCRPTPPTSTTSQEFGLGRSAG